MMMRSSMVMAVATLLLGSVACGPALENGESLADTSSDIIKGTDSKRESVVLLVHFDGDKPGSSCSGTMIAKNLVLTARHCTAELSGDTVVSNYTTTDLFVYTGISARKASATKAGAAARGSKRVSYKSQEITGQDVALIVLDQDVNVPIATVATETPTKGEKLTTVGYGLTEDSTLPAKRQERTDRTVTGNEDSRFILDESACSGDSGGPAMRPGNVVVGVAEAVGGGDGEGKAGFCVGAKTVVYYTSVTSVADLIDAGLKAAAKASAAAE